MQQLRDEIELEAGQLQPEFGERAPTATCQSAHRTSALPRQPCARHPFPASHWPPLLLPAATLQTSTRCAASCAPASTTSSSPRQCSWWVVGAGWTWRAGWLAGWLAGWVGGQLRGMAHAHPLAAALPAGWRPRLHSAAATSGAAHVR